MTNNKYLIALIIFQANRPAIEKVQEEISWRAALPPPFKKLPPHVTAFRPIGLASSEERALIAIIKKIAAAIPSFSATITGPLDNFGKKYVVRRLPLTPELSMMQAALIEQLPSLAGFEFELYDKENTFHITYAENLHKIFDEVWENIKCIEVEDMKLYFNAFSLYRKEPGGEYKHMEIFPFQG